MSDLVVTCPKGFWEDWLVEGDCAGEPWSGEEWGWWLSDRIPRPPIGTGTPGIDEAGRTFWRPSGEQRLYVVAHGQLRGYAPIVRLVHDRGVEPSRNPAVSVRSSWVICRQGGAVAVTIPEPIPGFRGWRRVWWSRDQEIPFPNWKTAGVGKDS